MSETTPGQVPENGTPAHDDEDTGPIGIFPSWTAVYVSVVVFTVIAIALLAWFTSALNYSVAS